MSDLVSRLLEAIEAKEEKARRANAGGIKWDATPEMAEVIRDHLPDDVLRRCEAEKALLNEHGSREVASLDPDTRGQTFIVCRVCRQGDRQIVHPCPTVRFVGNMYGITEEET